MPYGVTARSWIRMSSTKPNQISGLTREFSSSDGRQAEDSVAPGLFRSVW